uniref:hypothetical protein n=1 Tax=Flavobacterium sp. TaxID=239 RepID=UPI00404AE778
MTTITLKINEKTKKGRAFLEMARAFFENSKEIEIIENPKIDFSEFKGKLGLSEVQENNFEEYLNQSRTEWNKAF